MTNPLARLESALSDRYRIERELGQGGMATVYLAQELKHSRLVAIKVLRPELANVIGADRFLLEIETTARLTHPGILPLLDSGNADGILWYAMPYFTGRTLKDRLTTHGPMPLPEALAVFHDVAGALDYAHRHGVLHRDLKPANILLQDDRAVLADFGIALPMGEAASRLTETGLSVGTPEYMSPEQALGDRNIDARSDIYALGCVLYQMLAGEPPFTGTTPQAVIAKRLMEPVPQLSTLRDVPRPVEAAITRALSRQPVDRFESVADFVRAVDDSGSTTIALPAARPPGRLRIQPRLLGALALVLVVCAAVVTIRARRPVNMHFDPAIVAVMPARINAPGHSLDYLREGILDFAAARLTGEGGPRAADPRATLAALRSVGEDNPSALAARLGAGKVLDESILSDGQHLTLTATLISYPGGVRQPSVSVTGPEDSLGALVDQLMIHVLALHAGEHPSALTQVSSLPAWRAYLQGKAAYRVGRYKDAATHFDEAVAIDSTFTLASLADISALVRASRNSDERTRMVFRDLHRLGSDDSLWFYAIAGPGYPGSSSGRDQLATLEALAERLPDRADAWFELGDAQLHLGAVVELDSSIDRAKQSFGRALALDSSFALAIEHLLFIAYDRDTAAVRGLTRLYLAHDSLGDRSDFYRWRSAVALGDSTAVMQQRARFPAMSDQAIRFIIGSAQEDGVGVGDAMLADSVLQARAATEAERRSAQLVHGILALNLGRPTAPPLPGAYVPVDNAVFADGDTMLALPAVREIRARPKPAVGTLSYSQWDLAAWDLMHGDVSTAATFVAGFRTGATPVLSDSGSDDDVILAPGLLEAWAAMINRSASAGPLLNRLDSLLATGPRSNLVDDGNLILGRLFMALGQPERALRALQRVNHYLQSPYGSNTIRLARARAAAAAGRKEEAIRSYQVYLSLRATPGPRLLPQRDSARAGLKALMNGK